jgi:Glycosyl hydrolase family 63 N-terminal domain
VSGIMWGTPSVTTPLDIRHEARNEDDLATFGWRRHDLRSYGEQTIRDDGLQIETSFVKDASVPVPASADEGVGSQRAPRAPGLGYGGRWALRVKASEATADALARQGGFATLYWYLGDAQPGAAFDVPTPPSIEVCFLACRAPTTAGARAHTFVAV